MSPLIANIALSALDDHFDQQWHQAMGTVYQRVKRRKQGLGTWKLIRFADDFVIVVHGQRHHAEALRDEVAGVIAPLGLRLSPDKTRVVHVDDGFDFLGQHIRRQRKRGTQKHYVYTRPSKKAIKAIKAKVSAMTYRSTRDQDTGDLLRRVSRVLGGWANYHRHAVSKAIFSAIDAHAWRRIARWIRLKHDALSMRAFAADSAIAAGDSPATVSCSPAPPALRWSATGIAAIAYRRRGHKPAAITGS